MHCLGIRNDTPDFSGQFDASLSRPAQLVAQTAGWFLPVCIGNFMHRHPAAQAYFGKPDLPAPLLQSTRLASQDTEFTELNMTKCKALAYFLKSRSQYLFMLRMHYQDDAIRQRIPQMPDNQTCSPAILSRQLISGKQTTSLFSTRAVSTCKR